MSSSASFVNKTRKGLVENNPLLWTYLQTAATSIEGAAFHGDNKINFKCPICGDGHTGRKKRGWIVWDKKIDLIYYKCFNSSCPAADDHAWHGSKFLKEQSPILYKQYICDLLGKDDGLNLSKLVAKKPKKKIESTDNEKLDVRFFVPIMKGTGELFDLAKNMCEKRMIDPKIWHKFFVATGGKYKNRMVIPYFDDKGEIYYYQARTLVGQEPKYLNRKSSKADSLYNIYNIDKTKPVMVLEGPIDSMFVKNSVAVMGISKDLPKLKNLDLYWIYDNDETGKSAAIEGLMSGRKVFLWEKFLKAANIKGKVKDINDLYINMNRSSAFTFAEFKDFFSDNRLDKIWLI